MENGSTFPYCRRAIKTDGVTQEGKPAADWSWRFKEVGRSRRKIHGAVNPETRCRELRLTKWLHPRCQEKPLRSPAVTVPQTDTGRRGEYPKALVRTLV